MRSEGEFLFLILCSNAGTPLEAQTTKETDAANLALVAMERRAFELTRAGQLDEAKTLLLGPEYTAQKTIYGEGMDQLGRQLADSTAAAMQAERQRIYLQFAGGGIVIALLIVGWIAVVRLADRRLEAQMRLHKIERDLDIAREIQLGLLPKDIPNTPGFEIEGWGKPADQTGGDYFDWMELPDGGTLITLADVSGHGIGPALIVAVCRAYMRAAAAGGGVALQEALARVNDLLQLDIPAGRFVTAGVGILHPASSRRTFISAGQAPVFFYRAATRAVENWAADELPLGIASGLTFEDAREVQFAPGDALVLATDGFFEWSNETGEQFGIRRLEAFVAAHAHEPPTTFIEKLHSRVVAHAAGTAQPDDLTIVIVKRTVSETSPADPTEDSPRSLFIGAAT